MPSNFPSDPSENAYPEILGGDQRKQIEAVRSYLLTLGGGLRAARPGALPAPRPAASPAARAAAR
jgi:hypothetical protein